MKIRCRLAAEACPSFDVAGHRRNRSVTAESGNLASRVSVFALVTTLLTLSLSSSAAAQKNAVLVCHLPNEDPTASQTILVSEGAVNAHLAHGDSLGSCVDVPALCGPGTQPCGEFCRDLATDENNCGRCDLSCQAGEICRNGECVLLCESPGDCGNGACDIGESCTTCPQDCLLESELCDGLDNDCDGEIDEGFPLLNEPCTQGMGSCQRAGSIVCNASGDGTECSATPGDPSAETCDGLDNDCDGFIDEDLSCNSVSTHCGEITSDQTWYSTAQHVVTCDVSVTSGATLTVEAGSFVRMNPGTSLLVGQTEPGGRILLQGEQGSPISIVSAGTDPQPGDWGGLYIGPPYGLPPSIIEYVTIENCGQASEGCIVLNGASPQIGHSTIRYSHSRGIYATGASLPYVYNTTIRDNNTNGMDIASPGGLSDLSPFASNLITGNGGYPIGLPADAVNYLDPSCTFSGNGFDHVNVSAGTVSRTAFWSVLDVPYHVIGDILVGGVVEPVLTLAPGTALLFGPASDLIVGGSGTPGAIYAAGTQASPILLSSLQQNQAPGDWGGIQINQCDSILSSTLGHIIVEYAGGNGFGNVVFRSCDGTMQNSTVRYSSHWGIYIDTASPMILNITYADNTAGDVGP